MERGEQAAAARCRGGRPVGDEGAGAAARDDDAHRLERLEARAHARPAQAELEREVALARQAVARPELALLDQAAARGRRRGRACWRCRAPRAARLGLTRSRRRARAPPCRRPRPRPRCAGPRGRRRRARCRCSIARTKSSIIRRCGVSSATTAVLAAAAPSPPAATRPGRRLAQVGGDHAVALDHHGPLGAGDLDAARVARPGRGRGLERRDRLRLELQQRQRHVLALDRVQRRGREAQHARHVAEQPEQEVDGVDALVDERGAAVELDAAAPVRGRVVLGRTVPLDPRRGQQHAAEAARRRNRGAPRDRA